MANFKKILNNFEGYCCVVFLSVMAIVVFMQVVCRFILKTSLPWSEEVSRYLLVWTTFMGGAYGVQQGAHIGVEAFTLLFPKRFRKVLSIFVMACCLILCAIIFKYGVDIVVSQLQKRQLTPAMRLPIGYMYLAIPVGMVFFMIRYLINIVIAIRNFKKPEEADGNPAEHAL